MTRTPAARPGFFVSIAGGRAALLLLVHGIQADCMADIIVTAYDPAWPLNFARLRDELWPHLADCAVAIEHVGSTAVPGLAAKPIIDLVIVVAGDAQLRTVLMAMTGQGYEHRGDLGIAGREALRNQRAERPAHHLYACRQDNLAFRNHRAVRDALRGDAAAVAEYAALKHDLARRFPHDIDQYIAGKSAFLLGLLRRAGFTPAELALIAGVNSAPFNPPGRP